MTTRKRDRDDDMSTDGWPAVTPAARADLLEMIVAVAGVRIMISSYLTVTELVAIRGVCQAWHQFSDAGCWQRRLFRPSNLQLLLAGHQMRLGSMPYLDTLTLHDDKQLLKRDVIPRLVSQLGGRHDMQLTKLVAADLTVDVCCDLPKTLTSVDCRLYSDALQSLISDPLPLLQHCDIDTPLSDQVSQLMAVSPQMTSLTVHSQALFLHMGGLTACHRLVALTLSDLLSEVGSLDGLHVLPQLKRLTAVSADCLQSIPALRTAMVSHLPANQQHDTSAVEINMVMQQFRPTNLAEYDQWWRALLRGSHCCSQLIIDYFRMSDAVWNEYLRESRDVSSSLRRLTLRSWQRPAQFITFAGRHPHLTQLAFDHRVSSDLGDPPLVELLSNLPHLADLSVAHHLPSVIDSLRQGLTASGALTKLRQIDLTATLHTDGIHTLQVVLGLLRECTGLRRAAIGLILQELDAAVMTDIQSYSEHIPQLHVHVSVTFARSRVHTTQPPQPARLLAQLLLIPNITALTFVHCDVPLRYDEIARVRRQAGLNSIDVYRQVKPTSTKRRH